MLAPATSPSPPPTGFSPEREENWRDRSIEIGIVATLLFHLLLVWLTPHFSVERIAGSTHQLQVKPRGRDFDIQLAPAEVPPEQKNAFKFVETNPDAPENTPDKTDNISNRNQQSAQPDPDKTSKERTPRTTGRDDIKNDTQIISGDMARPQNGATVTPSAAQETQTPQTQQQQARAQQIPLSGTEKIEGKTEEGVGSNVFQNRSPSTNAPELVEGARDSRNPEGGMTAGQQTNRAQPKARPRLTQAPPAILQNRIMGAPDAGIIGYDARWTEYGQYLSELSDIVRAQWYKLLEDKNTMPPVQTYVQVTFTINSDGQITKTSIDEETAGRSWAMICTAAIEAPQPYRAWSKPMIDVLGKEQKLTYRFLYYW